MEACIMKNKQITLFSITVGIVLAAFTGCGDAQNRVDTGNGVTVIKQGLSSNGTDSSSAGFGVKTDDLDYSSGNPLVEEALLKLGDDLREMRIAGVTEKEQTDCVKRFMNRPQSLMFRSAHDRFEDYITNKLNAREQTLYKSNPAKALLCMSNGLFALNTAKQQYSSETLHNGNGDAFRHTLWNYAMYCDVGYAFAKEWSDAHEYGSTDQPLIEQQMDLHNNGVGLQLGSANPNTVLHSTFIDKTKQKVRNGDCRIISGASLARSNAYGEL
jgi:hypothetical protein